MHQLDEHIFSAVTGVTPLLSVASAPHFLRRGTSKDVYEFGDVLLVVSTDRLSVCGRNLSHEIKGKGWVVNQLSAYWFRKLRPICPNHLVSMDQETFPEPIRAVAAEYDGQAMLVWKTTPLPIRCVVRGFLAGAGWNEYRETGRICGNILPPGMVESQRLPAPIFTATTKGGPNEESRSVEYPALQELLGSTLAEQLRESSIHLYFNAWKIAREKNVLIADTAFEFGLHDGKLILIDECLTPDSSRFWSMDRYSCGGPMPTMNKHDLMDSFEDSGMAALFPLPGEVLSRLGEKYREVYRRIVGRSM